MPKTHFLTLLTFLAITTTTTIFAAPAPAPLQTRDLSTGAIDESPLDKDDGFCISYLYYGENTKKAGGESCWSAAMSCYRLPIDSVAYFIVGSADYKWDSRGSEYIIKTFRDPLVTWTTWDMRDSNTWFCKDGLGSYGTLGISQMFE